MFILFMSVVDCYRWACCRDVEGIAKAVFET